VMDHAPALRRRSANTGCQTHGKAVGRDPKEPLLLPTPEDVDRLPLRALPGLIAELSALQGWAAMRLRHHDERPEPTVTSDRLLDASQAAARIGMSEDWLYRHRHELPFTRHLGTRTVRFSDAGITRWLETRR